MAWHGPQNIRGINREKVAKILTSPDLDPLDFLVRIVGSEEIELPTRVQAAALALPYLRPRLSAMVVADATQKFAADPVQLLERLNDRIKRLAPPRDITITPETGEAA